MNFIKKIGFIFSGLAALYLAYITATGEILNYISFADPLNEMGFCFCALMIAAGFLIIGFTKDNAYE